MFERSPEELADLESVALEGYAAGLADAGWSGDLRLVRLGYLIAALIWMGATLPGWTAYILGEGSNIDVQAMFGRSKDEVLRGWLVLAEFLMERAEEARSLIRTPDP